MGTPVCKVFLFAVLLVFALSGFALSRSVDWGKNGSGIEKPVGFFDPVVLEAGVATPTQTQQHHAVPNLTLAEEYFVFVPGLDVLEQLSDLQSSTSPMPLETMANEEVLRGFYEQYLVSLLAAGDALNNSEKTDVRVIEPATRDGVNSIIAANTITDAGLSAKSADRNGQIFPDEIAPVPHSLSVARQEAEVLHSFEEINSAGVAGLTSVPVEGALQHSSGRIIEPVPSPASVRPVLAVRPMDVTSVMAARGVSVDRLVHRDVKGSWPRRLDQINALNSGNIFLQNWGQARVRAARRVTQLPNGFFLVSTNN